MPEIEPTQKDIEAAETCFYEHTADEAVDVIAKAIATARREGVESERERCARIADIWSKAEAKDGVVAAKAFAIVAYETGTQIAQAIRKEPS